MARMFRISVVLVAALSGLFLTCRPITEDGAPLPVVAAELNEMFALQEGQTAEFRDPGVTVTFLTRPVDSRCPEGQRCSVPGRVIVRFLFADSSQVVPFSVDGFLSNTAEDLLEADIADFRLALVKVEPYPESAGDGDGNPASVTAILRRP